MHDISNKTRTLCTAMAQAIVVINPETIKSIQNGAITGQNGDLLPLARAAAILAAKNTQQFIINQQAISLDYIDVGFEVELNSLLVTVLVKAICKTGVEMVALTAATVAALNIYDNLKVYDDCIEISSIKLLKKHENTAKYVVDLAFKTGVLVISDRATSGERSDRSAKIIIDRLNAENGEVVAQKLVPDDIEAIENAICQFSDELDLDLIITTGGTGLGPRDFTSEIIGKLIEKPLPGVEEHLRSYSQERTPYAMLSRLKAGTRGSSVIIALPGSPRAVQDGLNAIFPHIKHAIQVIRGCDHD